MDAVSILPGRATVPSILESGIKSLGDLISKNDKFIVPIHQRDYSWTREEVSQLWNDLREAIEEANEEYYLGSMVFLKEKSSKELCILDGQQRIATVLMLLAAIRNIYKDNNDRRADGMLSKYFGQEDRETLELLPRIEMNIENSIIFKEYVLSYTSSEKISKKLKERDVSASNRLIIDGISHLQQLIQEFIEQESPDCYSEKPLLRIERFIDSSAMVMQITVSDEANAYTFFETLNNRGLELTTMDLLKNYVFGKSGKRLEVVKADWTAMRENLVEENQLAFLRHFWISKNGLIRAPQLYRRIRESIGNSSKVVAFASDLKKASRVYAALGTSDHQFWENYTDKTKSSIEALNILDAILPNPVLLAAVDAMQPEEVEKIFWLMEVMTVRYILIGSRSPGGLEAAYAEIAMRIHNKELKSPAAVFRELQSKHAVYPSDEEFRAQFEIARISRPKHARYVLQKLCDSESALKITKDPKQINLEHIAPKNPNEFWNNVAKNGDFSWSEFKDRIGNLTLCEKASNKSSGNTEFQKKKTEVYSKSEINMTKKLLTYDQWTNEEVISRQK